MSQKFRNIKGTFDLLPDAYSPKNSKTEWDGTPAWHYVENTIRKVMAKFHYEEIRTPIFEQTELIARGIGQFTDVVSKEMFAFERAGTHYVLRPELTAPIMRSYLQHHLAQKGGTQRLFYIGPCFRAEEPQEGRYRQFHQFGCELIGATDPRADAEVIALMIAIYDAFGVTGNELKINSLGSPESREAYKTALQDYFAPFVDDLSETSRQRLEKNPLRILDTKIEKERALLVDAPNLSDFLSEESKTHYQAVKNYLDDLGISWTEDPYLVRGLDYYSETAFELVGKDLGAQSALGGGGRYDRLALELGSKQPVPAIGFAAGLERLFIALRRQGINLPEAAPLDAFLVSLGDAAERFNFKLAHQLRNAGRRVATDLKGRSMKAQMKEANRQNATFVVILGDDELEKNIAIIRNMESGEQEEVALDAIISYF